MGSDSLKDAREPRLHGRGLGHRFARSAELLSSLSRALAAAHHGRGVECNRWRRRSPASCGLHASGGKPRARMPATCWLHVRVRERRSDLQASRVAAGERGGELWASCAAATWELHDGTANATATCGLHVRQRPAVFAAGGQTWRPSSAASTCGWRAAGSTAEQQQPANAATG